MGHKQRLAQEAMVVLEVAAATIIQGRHRPTAELVTLEIIRQQKVQMVDLILISCNSLFIKLKLDLKCSAINGTVTLLKFESIYSIIFSLYLE